MAGAQLQNPITAAQDDDDRRRLSELFPQLADSPTPFLALRPYLRDCPERFFDRSIHARMIGWLTERDARQRGELQQFFLATGMELSMAMLFLRQINSESWHDRPLVQGDDFEVVSFIDKVLHPAYLRLSEGVLAALIRPLAHFARLDRGKGTQGLDVFNLAQELSKGPMSECVAAYNHVVRNGIGHGGITYLQSDIRYRDKKGNTETLDVWSVVRLCDDMVDTCNALVSAIKLFLITSAHDGYHVPQELLVEELIQETSSPWWSISGCMESELADTSQLLVYARPNSRDVLKIQWASVQSAALAEILAPGYDRYFFSLRSSHGWSGWAAFDGAKLRAIRQSGTPEVHDYAVAFGDGGFFFVPRPALPRALGRLDSFFQSFRLRWPIAIRQIRHDLGRLHLVAREAKMHRNAWGYVLRGAVVIPDLSQASAVTEIRANRRRILRAASRAARGSVSPWNPIRLLPLGYACIGVFSSDFRERRLGSFGLGQELICTIQLQRIRRIKSPDIMGSTVESSGNWRIAWNAAWLESGGADRAADGLNNKDIERTGTR